MSTGVPVETDESEHSILDNQVLWRIIHKHFQDNSRHLVAHHIESYNDFFRTEIFNIFRDNNPITIVSGEVGTGTKEFKHKCLLYLGGKDGKRIYFGKPVIHDHDRIHYMYPNEARLRNMTYSMTVHYDVEVEFIDRIEAGERPYELGPEFLGGNSYTMDFDDDGPQYYPTDNTPYVNYKLGGGHDILLSGGDDPELPDSSSYEDSIAGGAKRASKKSGKLSPEVAATLRNMNDQSMIDSNTQKRTIMLEKIYLGKIPVMVQSDYCILGGMPKEMRHGLGECRNDPGGYFIVAGKEKTIAVQEKFGDNMLYIKKGKEAPHEDGVADDFLWSVEIKSVSENVSKPKRSMSVRIQAPSKSYTNLNIVVNIPNVRAPVPLFIVFRALGILSDREIINMCLLDMEKYEFMIDSFAPSVHDAGGIMQQHMALVYIGELTKYQSTDYALEVLSDFFLPHVGESNFKDKAYYLGYMVFRLLSASMGLEQETDRDHLKYKRIEPFGALFKDLFQEYYSIQLKHIYQEFDKRIYFNLNEYEHHLFELIYHNYREVFSNRIVDEGIRKAFKGSWGAQTHTKRVGIVQDLNRLSFNSALSHLRKINLPLDSSLKVVGPRILHSSHWGYIDFIDTPDGANIGLHKTFAITTYVSRGYSRETMIEWLREKIALKPLADCSPLVISSQSKVFVNGHWCGVIDTPIESVSKIRMFRRNGLVPVHTSVSFDIRKNTVYIYTDAGRMCRPIFYKDDVTKRFSFDLKRGATMKHLREGEITWTDLVSGFNAKKVAANYHYTDTRLVELDDLYDGVNGETNPAKMERFIKDKAAIEYIDSSEMEQSLVALNMGDWNNNPDKQARYTHMEMHPSFLFGIMCNQVIFPENNPAARISFSCSQSRQACSLYHTNFQVRMDKTATVLNQGQVPLLKSRYMTHINKEEHPYGENAIVAIMCYTGYNVEDAILVNEGALKRGLFQTTYYTSYQEHEEKKRVGDITVDKRFTCVETEQNVIGLKPGHDYSKLDEYGLIRENTPVDDKTIIIGYTTNSAVRPEIRVDSSVTTKKGQLGIVDKAFITEGEEGERIAKVRIREIRVPNLGDKMASRAGQKGTVGLVIPEKDMPFTKDGIRPDLIINPHALPTRQTIGHLVECLIGKTCLHYGGFSDCTAFNNEGSKAAMFGKLLTGLGYHSSGNEIVYNGMTGDQIDMEIFMGPNYYMRLKHMVKDKVNYRALGPRTALTKQPVAGRANDGGLRIGEMERDVLISHGMSDFLRESMMERGDKYYMAVCNTTGLLAIYNPAKNLFMSPMADGPVKYFKGDTGSGHMLDATTKYGRRFSLVSVPYSLKLLIQELQTINVQLRIITEDNIAQIESMCYSDNIQKLTIDPTMTPDKLVESIKQLVKGVEPPLKTPKYEEPRSENEPQKQYPATSPEGSLPQGVSPEGLSANGLSASAEGLSPESLSANGLSPDYPDTSPAFMPEVIERDQSSPGYMPQKQPSFIESATKAVTDLFTPAQPAKQTGGSVEDFQLGGQVYYLRSRELGLPADHLWNVAKKGARLVTINSGPHAAFSNPNDYIQIAKCDELMRPESVEAMRMRQQQQPYQHPQEPQHLFGYGGDRQLPPQIHVNPIIKIVNGDDNSTSPTEDAPQQHTQDQYQDATFSSLQIQNPGSMIGGTKNNRVDSQAPETPSYSDDNKSILGGLRDFGSLVINKLSS
jgi:DNA-directed RNA polymerase II subunit RPB2